MTPAQQRANSRKAIELLTAMATSTNIEIGGYLRNLETHEIVSVVINFVPPIKESDLKR
jgi:hypothetical protein